MGNDRQHFEDYREQTRVKHEILTKYLNAYLTILKANNQNLVYIDAFAGRGSYTNALSGQAVDGSPLLALKLISDNPEFSQRVTAVFVEADPELCEQLQTSVTAFYGAHNHMREPAVMCGRFADCVGEIMDGVGNLAPTFLFVDPCGVTGTSFATIKRVLDNRACEAFIFFNVDGVKRIAGLQEQSIVLAELLGSEKRAAGMLDQLQRTTRPTAKERVILECYRQAIREAMGVQFTAPFRVESEDRRKTSHYLIHATKNPLGFSIMKDVMWRAGHASDGPGAMELAQASRETTRGFFDLRLGPAKSAILQELKGGKKCVDLFAKKWVYRPDDLLSTTAYKEALLELERDGKVIVLGKDGRTPTPADSRRKVRGKQTLGDGYYICLA